jgi:endoplasmic reticulum Man9GlcNAc2 1,2-alpha-mannosidase
MHRFVPGTQHHFEEEVLNASTSSAEERDLEARRNRVKEVFMYSWKGYVDNAWGKDVYKPISGIGLNMIPNGLHYGTTTEIGLGWVIIDALDTMMLMNLTEEVARARKWIAQSLTWDQDHEVSLFETTIRMLGGLLSAHYLSGDELYLNKAIDLADRLLGGFDTPTGIPYASVNLKQRTGHGSISDGGSSTTAEVSTLQLEFKYLTKLTGDTAYWEKAERVIEALENNKAQSGLVPIFVNPLSGRYTTTEIRLGSRGDSYYGAPPTFDLTLEYLLKQYLQTSKSEPVYRQMYDHAMDGVKEHLVGHSQPSGLTYVGELHSGVGSQLSPKMDHLVCFLGGNLVLGATEGKSLVSIRGGKNSKVMSERQLEDLKLGEEITASCFEIYNSTATGLAPEIVRFNTDINKDEDIIIKPNDRYHSVLQLM